jgi:hypothetical protein
MTDRRYRPTLATSLAETPPAERAWLDECFRTSGPMVHHHMRYVGRGAWTVRYANRTARLELTALEARRLIHLYSDLYAVPPDLAQRVELAIRQDREARDEAKRLG